MTPVNQEDPDREAVNASRRTLLAFAGIAVAATSLDSMTEVAARDSETDVQRHASAFSHAGIKQVQAGSLDVGYAEMGPAGGPCAVLLHGWPYDIHSYEAVAPILAEAGFRVLVPYLRGHGTTRFLSTDTMRNAQQYVLAADVLAFMDALRIERAVLGGYDWGGRIANVLAALHPDRCSALVAGSGYLIGSRAAGASPLPPRAELQWWYQYYFATERGRAGYAKNTRDFARLIWELASPKWRFEDATFDRCATAFNNPDHVEITVHNYRWRLGLAVGEARYDTFEARLADFPVISVPTITVEGDANGAPHPAPASYASKYVGRYEHRTLSGGVGHNPPHESPVEFAKAIMDVSSL